MKYEPHPYAEIFPLLNESEAEVINFNESVLQEGIKVPIVLYQGKILDGRNRYRAWQQAPDKIELRTEEFVGTDTEALQYTLILNNERRHLNTSQRALAGWRYSRLENNLDTPSKTMDKRVRDIFRVSDDSLRMVGNILNDKKYSQSEKSILVSGIAHGVALDFVHKLLKNAPKESWSNAIQGAMGGGSKSSEVKEVIQLIKNLKREKREIGFANKTVAANRVLEDDSMVYGVIYIDPPWRFEVRSENGMDRSAENHYPTMTIDDIRGMKIPAADDCVMFMWVTVPHLHNGIEMLKSWGFKYKSAYFWHKTKPGLGYWSANTMEILLLGVKGEIPAPLPDQRMEQVIRAEQGRHSEKPEVFADGITKMFPNVAKCEMFSRGVKHQGEHWYYHGNEAGQIESTTTDASARKRNGRKTKAAGKEAEQEEAPL